jgi:hypothetical protein
MKRILLLLLFALAVGSFSPTLAQPDYFFPGTGPFRADIPSPEQFLGYPIGSHHTRYDQIVAYFQLLSERSERMALLKIGRTHEHREQITAIFTAPANHARLEEIRHQHLARATNEGGDEIPLVVHLGYNVHGNEPSGGEAALLTAYYLAANETIETQSWLEQMVILLDPVYNPDGRDRHTNWANMHKASPPVEDSNDREHNEVWPGGRTNHYWFDLNRDWFLGVHPESRNRMKIFHQWRPYVATDHHEMGTNSTFYFDPGKNSSNNPVVPPFLYDAIYPNFSRYFSQALDAIGSQYFTKELFDKLYPGYGSSYANFYGGAGFLFEQASSRGHAQETNTIPLTFAYTIRNQFAVSLATLRGALAEKPNLLMLRRGFYRAAREQARANPVKGYVFGDEYDLARTYAFVNLLRLHQIEVYALPAELQQEGKTFSPNKAFVVPAEQENYFMVRSAFEKSITYQDSTFYDASSWSLPHAFNLPYAELKGRVPLGVKITADLQQKPTPPARSDYAYLMDLRDYYAHKAIYQLQEQEVIVKIAFKPFTFSIDGQARDFSQGAVIIPVQQQKLSAEEVYKAIQEASQNCSMVFYPVHSGLSIQGIDLGSTFARPLKKPKALMVVGPGVSAYEAGETWHLLDQRVGMPIAKVEAARLKNLKLADYTAIVMVSGSYELDKPTVEKIKAWLQEGGTLIAFKTATEWAIKQGLCKEELVPVDTTKTLARRDFGDAANTEGARRIGGAIFEQDLDVTNPIGFGFSSRKISVYRNGNTFLKPSKNPYATVSQYSAAPLIGGFVHPESLEKVANSAGILLSGAGQGRLILFADNPNFRGIWYGTNKLFLNALFFGPVISVPNAERGGE